jgi:hypothetical protein
MYRKARNAPSDVLAHNYTQVRTRWLRPIVPTSSLHGDAAAQRPASVVELSVRNLELREQLRELEEVAARQISCDRVIVVQPYLRERVRMCRLRSNSDAWIQYCRGSGRS